MSQINTSDTESQYLDSNLSVFNDIISTKMFDKRNDFYFNSATHATPHDVYLLKRFARASSHVYD